MRIPDVNAKLIQEAIHDFDANWRNTSEYRGWEQNRNYLHAIRYDGALYPPKKIISLATGMPTSAFYGGAPSNSYLTKRGFTIVRLREDEMGESESLGPYGKQIVDIESGQDESYKPDGEKDARDRILRMVVARRGQATFRKQLIEAYRSRCAISGCNVLAVLEAAHITPYLGPATNHISNGLLLRADLHSLWDLCLIAIDPDALTVWISPVINDDMYRSLDGVKMAAPAPRHPGPSVEALRVQWQLTQSGNGGGNE